MMKPRKGKTERKGGGYVCAFEWNTAATGLLAVSLPGLSGQDPRSGGASEQVKSWLPGQTARGSRHPGWGEAVAADRLVVVKKAL